MALEYSSDIKTSHNFVCEGGVNSKETVNTREK